MDVVRCRKLTVSVVVAAVGGMLLTGCGAASQDATPPATAKYIEGDWQCLTSSEDGSKANEYTYHLRVTASDISIGNAPTGEELYWTQYSYDLGTDGTMTTHPETGGAGWVLQLPEEITYEDVNDARIAEGWPENLEVSLTPDSAAWTGSTGLEWMCSRGDFEDDGNTFVGGS